MVTKSTMHDHAKTYEPGALTGRGNDQFMLRFPDGLRDKIKENAKRNKRSMNAEIVAILEASLRGSARPVTQFAFRIGQRLKETKHGDIGTCIGRCECLNEPNHYFINFEKNPTMKPELWLKPGEAVWWPEDTLSPA